MSFKKDFAWGTATASYQVEGAYNEDGKGLNWWDTFSHIPGKVQNNDTGDVACDNYHRYEEDVKLMAKIGIKAYRFSISWARIIPEGTGKINQKGIDFYNNLINCLIAHGIEPYITVYHWDMPQALADKGAWENPECIKWFADYAKVIAENFSDRVTHFFTLNEPQVIIGQSYESGVYPPEKILPRKQVLQVIHNILKAHGSAVKAIRENAKQPVKIGFAPCMNMNYPESDTPEDREATRKSMFALRENDGIGSVSAIWNDPVYFGKYPDEYFELYKDDVPEITEEDMKLISQPLDFQGENIYWGCMVRHSDNAKGFEIVKDEHGFDNPPHHWPRTPDSLYWGTKYIYERYHMPIIITENGMCELDKVSEDGKVHDERRIESLKAYLKNLKKSVDEGTDVVGYFYWSLMDNFEWIYGYTERFGLIHVNYQTLERTIKDSGYVYSEIIKSNGENL